MYDVSRVQVVDTQADLNEALPNEVVVEGLLVLPFDKALEVPVLTVLHDDVNVVAFDEGVIVADYEGRV